jgi:hypothetical protein
VGFDVNALKFLLAAIRDGVSLDRTVTIGRQGLFVEPPALLANLRRFDPKVPESAVQRMLHEADGFCEPVLRFLGAVQTESLDVSPYQGATIIHDMNRPLPAHLSGAFSAVIDGGSLEHVFNFPQAIKNCMEMVAVGGDFLCSSPANNFVGHGFYQFSPELFFRVFHRSNGFEVRKMLLYEEDWSDIRYYEVRDPEEVRRRVTLSNRHPTLLLVRARKVADVPVFAAIPQQSDYVTVWNTFGPGEKGAIDEGAVNTRGSLAQGLARMALRAVGALVPQPIKRRLRRLKRGADPFHRAFYTETRL